ncbi:hypothetical protein CONCODRAFT_78937 [Conidiobolus coronatus NRRL 28638]|uniref:Uncharacterized protein n=1 Tax=Conidiobolus coronatus (strain ATCC 28846 / CBS 209.66 / NRRL 28638) TaxID=796925 RepID=A0A137P5I3_CONC2|nr:hypothetical protein CONCODRAFT_78937 [Conidiobolus coronatus NRRL 28638]|eukprot:KXN70263.1 hypothetical protein CONCODRAFT_78937 [Conidiobolus coronatus NRRL 28638]
MSDNNSETKFIPTEDDVYFKSLLARMQAKVLYSLEVTWFHIHHNCEISIPIILFINLTKFINHDNAIYYSSIPSIFFFLISSLVYRLYEPMSLLILIGFYLQLLFNHTANQLNLYPAHVNWIVGCLGLQFLLSIPFTKTTVFYLIQPWATFNHPQRLADWHGSWQYAGFRKTMRVLTGVLGIGFILQAILATILVIYVSPNVTKYVCPVIAGVTIAGLMAWLAIYSRMMKKKGDEARARAMRQLEESQQEV